MTQRVTKPIALDKSFNTTGSNPQNIADVLANKLDSIKSAIENGGSGEMEAAFECHYNVTSATDIYNAMQEKKVPFFYNNGVVAQLWKVETNKYTFRTTSTRVVEGENILDIVDYIVNGSVWSTATKTISGGSSSQQAYLAKVKSSVNFDTTGLSGMQSIISVNDVPADGVYQLSIFMCITPKTASSTKSDLVFQFTGTSGTGMPNTTFHAVVDDSQTFAQQLSFSTTLNLKAGTNSLKMACDGLSTEYLVFVDDLTVAQLVNGVYHNGDTFEEVNDLTEATDFNADDELLVVSPNSKRKMLWTTLANKVLGFIKSLSTTITAFRSGDVIPVDGPSGTAKMAKDDLLRVAAENAVDSGVAASGDTMRDVVQSANAVTTELTKSIIGSIRLRPNGEYASLSTGKVVYASVESGKLYRVRIANQYSGSIIVIGLSANVPALDQTASVATTYDSTDTSEYIYDIESNINGYLILSCDVRIPNTGIVLGEIEYLGKLKNQDQIIADRINISFTPTENSYNTSEFVGQSVIHSTSAYDVLANAFNSVEFDTEPRYARIGNKRYGHDSSLCIVGSIAYTAYTCNDVNSGDSPGYVNAYVRLAITDISNLRTSTTSTYEDVARNGDSVGAETIISGAGVPNVIHNGGVLHIFFSGQLSDGKWYMLKREYTIATSTFSPIQKCALSINGNTYDFSATNVHDLINDECNSNYFLSMNADWAESNGTWYANLCSNIYLKSGIIFKTTDLDTFEEWLTPDVDTLANYEAALVIKGSYMFEAIRQYKTERGMMRLLKINMANKAIEEQMDIMDASSRPCWCVLDDKLYLFHSINYRQRIEIIKIVEGTLISSYVVCQGIHQCAYPSAKVYDGNMYMTYTGASFTNVYIRKVAFGSLNISKVFSILKKVKENYDR